MDISPVTNPLNDPENPDRQRVIIKDDYIWRSCCLVVDKRVVVFTSQFIITLMIITFSLWQLAQKNTCEHQQFYSSLITMLIGIFLPSPRVK